jgi:hypothetical protein
MKRLLILLALLPLLAIGGGQNVMTGNHRAVFSSVYVAPTYATETNATSGSASSTSITTSASTIGPSDIVYVFCRQSSSNTDLSINSTPANIETSSLGNHLNSPSTADTLMVAFYHPAAGSTTFTCSSTYSNPYLTLLVLQFQGGSISTTDYNNSSLPTYLYGSGTSTQPISSSFSTTAKGLIVFCEDQDGGATVTVGSIGALTTTLVNPINGPACEYAIPTAAQTGITASINISTSLDWAYGLMPWK